MALPPNSSCEPSLAKVKLSNKSYAPPWIVKTGSDTASSLTSFLWEKAHDEHGNRTSHVCFVLDKRGSDQATA